MRKKRGRPSLKDLEIKRVVIRVCLTLYEGQDDDLIDWFDTIEQGKKAKKVKTALRQGGANHQKIEENLTEFIDDDFLDSLLSAI